MFLSSSTSRLTEQDRGLSEGIRGAASCGNLGRYLVPPRQEEEKDGRKGREGGREGGSVVSGRKDEDAAGEGKWQQHSAP